jgi:hypothetical protein
VYNKLFTKILDSSIWLESTPTRIVWLTFIAVMDEDGFAAFASVGNVAHRARVTLEEAAAAIALLEGPDPDSGDPDNQGKRLERVPGGWMVLNAKKHRDMVTRVVIQEQTRERVRRHRELKRNSNGSETHQPLPCNAPVTPSESESDTETKARSEARKEKISSRKTATHPSADALGERFVRFWNAYPNKKGKSAAFKAWQKLRPTDALTDIIIAAIEQQKTWQTWRKDSGQFVPHPASWLNKGAWEDEPYAETMVAYENRPPQRHSLCPHTPQCERQTECTRKTINDGRRARGVPLLEAEH